MNIGPLRKTILKESAIFGALAVVFAGVAFFVDGMHEDYVQKKRSAEASANQMASEKRNVENRFLQVKEGLPVYEESQRRIKEAGLFIDSQAVRDLFNEYQPRYMLKKVGVEMQPIMEYKDDPKYVKKNFVVTKTSAKVKIETATDEDVYALIKAMQKELPGFTRITGFSLLKKQELSKEFVSEIRKSGTYPMIGAEMTFDWYGLKSTDPESPFNRYITKKKEGGAL